MPKKLRLRLKQEGLLVAVLALLSIVVVMSSVAGLLNGLSKGSPTKAVTRLPDVLFNPEPEIQLPSPPPALSASVTPETSTSPSQSPSRPQARRNQPTVSAPLKTSSMIVSISGVISGRGKTSSVYDVTIKNSGSGSLKDFQISAHIPAGTQWKTGGGCTGGRPFTVRTSSAERVECVSGTDGAGTDDMSVHGISVQIPDELAAGVSLSVVFELDLSKEVPEEISNHAHVSSGGLSADSSTVRLRTS